MRRIQRLSACGLLIALMGLSGCYYYASGPNFSIYVTAEAAPTPTFTGFETTLTSTYATSNVAVYLTAHEWSVVNAAGPYILTDNGFTGTITPGVAGEYTIRYRTWYYTNYDHCCHATGYRESYVVLTAVNPPPG